MADGVTFEWDDAKRRSNLAKHGVDFADAENLEWDTALVGKDDRRDYGEDRFIAFAKLGDRLHCIAFTRRGKAVRIISFRKAHWKEKRFYDQKKR